MAPYHGLTVPHPSPLRPLLNPAPMLALLAALLAALQPGAIAASALLDSVKQNPELAKRLCGEFRQLNAQGTSATSRQSIDKVAASQNLSHTDAEILATYVIGLHCPDVR